MDNEAIEQAIANPDTFCKEMMSLWYEAKKKNESERYLHVTTEQFVKYVRELDEREILYKEDGVLYKGMIVRIKTVC